MARIPIQDVAAASGSNKDIFQALNKALGMVPNMTRVMANSPSVLQAFASFNGALAGSHLPPALREQIALVTAEENACAYCLSAHSALGKMAGLKPEQIDAARGASSSDAKTMVALTFAREVIRRRGGVGERDVQALFAVGWSAGEAAEIVATVALNVFTNIFNRAFDVDVDFPLVTPRMHEV